MIPHVYTWTLKARAHAFAVTGELRSFELWCSSLEDFGFECGCDDINEHPVPDHNWHSFAGLRVFVNPRIPKDTILLRESYGEQRLLAVLRTCEPKPKEIDPS